MDPKSVPQQVSNPQSNSFWQAPSGGDFGGATPIGYLVSPSLWNELATEKSPRLVELPTYSIVGLVGGHTLLNDGRTLKWED